MPCIFFTCNFTCNFKCEKCLKNFTRKQNYLYHINNIKRPCKSVINNEKEIIKVLSPKTAKNPPKTAKKTLKSINENENKENKENKINPFILQNINNKCIDDNENNGKNNEKSMNVHEIIINDFEKITNENYKNKLDSSTCKFCNKIFTRLDSLQKHLKDRCKIKIHYDEFEKLKEKFNDLLINNKDLVEEIEILKKQINSNNSQIINNSNTLNKNNINNGTINNNNLNIQLVQFVHGLMTFLKKSLTT
jgi:hypothetical protein